MSDAAARYDRRYPGVDIPTAQKEERMQRIDFKEERKTLQRTSRTNSFVVPELPWHRDKDKDTDE